MNLNLSCIMLVLDNEESTDIRRNDVKRLKILLKDNEVVKFKFDNKSTLKNIAKEGLSKILGSKKFHLEQIYTLGEEKYFFDNSVDLIYLGVTNISNVKKLDKSYELVDLIISNNKITLGNNTYKFRTKQNISDNNIEYIHEIDIDNIRKEKDILEILIAYKYLRVRLDNSDILFKFLGSTYTLEDARIVYEMVKEVSVDKSNFRKKLMRYSEKVDEFKGGKGYRPTQMYKFVNNEDDVWL